MKLFGLNATREYTQRLAGRLGIDLAAHEERDFEDGEFKVRALESVRGEQVIVCQSLAADADFTANDKLMRLLVFIGALKDAAAAEVTAVVPYLAYWRKDQRTKARDPVTTRYLARMFEAVGVDAVATFDAHSLVSFDNAFDCRKEHLEARALFVAHFAGSIGAGERVVVVSPDAGGVKRARAFAADLGTRLGRGVELAFVEKHRSEGRVSGDLFAGEVEGATAIVFDDLVSSGTTVVRAVAACRARGARTVHAAATHGVLAEPAAAALDGAGLASFVVTDTVADVRRRCAALSTRVAVLDTAPIVADAIAHWAETS
jgi:ribose-phosphate pyrophosphokinase